MKIFIENEYLWHTTGYSHPLQTNWKIIPNLSKIRRADFGGQIFPNHSIEIQ